MFCAPTATLEAMHAAVTAGSSTGEGNRAISSRVCPATSGKKASTNALASAGVLYIFQFAAISALRDMINVPQLDFRGWVYTRRVMGGTKRDEETLPRGSSNAGPRNLIPAPKSN